MVRPTFSASRSRADLLLRGHEAVPALFLDLFRHGAGQGVGLGALDGFVLEAADAIDAGFLQPVEQQLEVVFGLAGEADDEGRADGEVGADRRASAAMRSAVFS